VSLFPSIYAVLGEIQADVVSHHPQRLTGPRSRRGSRAQYCNCGECERSKSCHSQVLLGCAFDRKRQEARLILRWQDGGSTRMSRT